MNKNITANEKINKLIDGWHKETDAEKENDINEFIEKLIEENQIHIDKEYERKKNGMLIVAEMEIDEVKKARKKQLNILKFEQNQCKKINKTIKNEIKKLN